MRLVMSAFLSSIILSSHAVADIRVSYTDSSPTDIFVITNVSGCALYKGKVTIDFSTSKGGLVFDIMRNGWGDFDGGGGSYQPLRVVYGKQFVTSLTDVKDGEQVMVLEFKDFGHGDRITLNVDMDDTLGAYHPSVAGSEIEGGSINVITPAIESNGSFDNNAVAETDRSTCIS